MRRNCLALAAVALAAPGVAAPIEFSAVLTGEAGYGTNPFLRQGVTQGAPVVSGTFTPELVKRTARSTTTLKGDYNRDQYLSKFGYTDSLRTELLRSDQLTEHLSTNLSASFSTTNKALLGDPNLVTNDPLNSGRRTRQFAGEYQAQWLANAKDRFTYSVQASHSSFSGRHSAIPNAVASAYTLTGMTLGYDHALDARTSVGVQTSVSSVNSRIYPDSRTIQPSVTAKRQLNAIWVIDGHIGVVLQHTFGPFARSNTSLGYGANLCGTYPRTTICVSTQRSVGPSGYGSLRATNAITGSLKHQLTEHSRFDLAANYTKSSASQALVLFPGALGKYRALQVEAKYDRDLTERLSAGFGGSYRSRKVETIGTAHAVAGTVHITAKLGRI